MIFIFSVQTRWRYILKKGSSLGLTQRVIKKRMDSLILFKQTRKRKKSSNIYSWVNAYQLQNVLILWHHTEFQWGIAVGGEGVGGAREKEIECERKRERERVFRHIKLVKSYIYNHHYRWRSIQYVEYIMVHSGGCRNLWLLLCFVWRRLFKGCFSDCPLAKLYVLLYFQVSLQHF